VGEDHLVLDLYELTMLEAYIASGLAAPAAFELFVRRLPATRSFLVAAGLEQALAFLEGFRFSPQELDQLARVHRLSPAASRELAQVRFSGDVDAVPEGTVLFADEPILRVTAPLPEAQLVETRLINLVHLQTMVASKAARVVLAAAGHPVIDFGLRRAHGAEAGTLAARACYLAGFASTSNVRAGVDHGVPISGTMAHSFVQAHDREEQAFAAFAAARVGASAELGLGPSVVHRGRVREPSQGSRLIDVVLLIDTYDVERAAAKVVALAPALAARGARVAAVRIDSGDLAAHARRVRGILDGGGLAGTGIVVSGGLDEHEVAALVASGAPIDSYATGTKVVTSADAPYLDCAYKLVEYAGRPRLKRSEGKATWPGRKQVWRRRSAGGLLEADHLTAAHEVVGGAEPLLAPVMRGGRRLGPTPPLAEARARLQRELAALPDTLRGLSAGPPFAVEISSALRSR
jgi:nicotinate phosphoribosyltransferase